MILSPEQALAMLEHKKITLQARAFEALMAVRDFEAELRGYQAAQEVAAAHQAAEAEQKDESA
jgi:hypothetical protein